MTLIIRSARKEDVTVASCLLAETNGDFGVTVLGLGSPDLQLKALMTWFQDEGNRFSYQYAQIAEKYGLPVGLMLAFPGKMITRLELGLLRSMFKIYGFRQGIAMMRRNKDLSDFREADRDEYLIAHIGVDDQFRGQGIAKALLARAAEDASVQHLKKLTLEVEILNERAIQVYQKAGFIIAETFHYTDRKGLLKSPGFHKMTRFL